MKNASSFGHVNLIFARHATTINMWRGSGESILASKKSHEFKSFLFLRILYFVTKEPIENLSLVLQRNHPHQRLLPRRQWTSRMRTHWKKLSLCRHLYKNPLSQALVCHLCRLSRQHRRRQHQMHQESSYSWWLQLSPRRVHTSVERVSCFPDEKFWQTRNKLFRCAAICISCLRLHGSKRIIMHL